jgi:proteasome alpha subunit
VEALGQGEATPRVIAAEDLEVAVLDRTRPQKRKFKRIGVAQLTEMLGGRGETTEADTHAAGESRSPSTRYDAAPSGETPGEEPPVAPPVDPDAD